MGAVDIGIRHDDDLAVTQFFQVDLIADTAAEGGNDRQQLFVCIHLIQLIALDATTGQNALNQVEVFNEAVGIDGVILTKLDGTAKGGFIVTLCNELQVPVAYVGVGEKLDDIEDFDTDSFVEGII